MLNFNQYEVLTFDCYGTLIDWESSILATLKPTLLAHDKNLRDNQILELFAELETKIQNQDEYIRYRDVLRRVVQQFSDMLGFTPSSIELNCLANSLSKWLPFSDTVHALKTLKKKYKLAIISNIDDDLFALTSKHLQVVFDWVITAGQVKSYKPSLRNFEYAIKKIGVPSDKILHVAQSIYHDIIPAKNMGLSTVWVNRKGLKERCDTDIEVVDLKSLVSQMNLD
jgi:2-haloacid dehalogenase